MSLNKAEQNHIANTIALSCNKLYSQFCSDGLTEVGNYKIIKPLAEGSFGKVYLATHKLTHTKIVLKQGSKCDLNVVREVFFHRQFDFSYITKLYEVIVTETNVWMAMEYCSGRELYDYLISMGRIPNEEAKKLFAQICSGVYYSHSLKCVHRDLKLENILLDSNGHAKLTDFGFARDCNMKNILETVCGTTVYMAPELIERKNYDGYKIDVWALGVILYTMLFGLMPFDEADELKTKWAIINEDPVYDEQIVESKSAIDLLQKMLNKDPYKRPLLKEILMHEYLQPFGTNLLSKCEKALNKQRNSVKFQSKIEKRLLKKLKQCGFDITAIKNSVIKKKCDNLYGVWQLLLDRELRHQSTRRIPSRNRSILSVKKVFDTDGNISVGMHNNNLLGDDLSLKKQISKKMLIDSNPLRNLPNTDTSQLVNTDDKEPSSGNSSTTTNTATTNTTTANNNNNKFTCLQTKPSFEGDTPTVEKKNSGAGKTATCILSDSSDYSHNSSIVDSVGIIDPLELEKQKLQKTSKHHSHNIFNRMSRFLKHKLQPNDNDISSSSYNVRSNKNYQHTRIEHVTMVTDKINNNDTNKRTRDDSSSSVSCNSNHITNNKIDRNITDNDVSSNNIIINSNTINNTNITNTIITTTANNKNNNNDTNNNSNNDKDNNNNTMAATDNNTNNNTSTSIKESIGSSSSSSRNSTNSTHNNNNKNISTHIDTTSTSKNNSNGIINQKSSEWHSKKSFRRVTTVNSIGNNKDYEYSDLLPPSPKNVSGIIVKNNTGTQTDKIDEYYNDDKHLSVKFINDENKDNYSFYNNGSKVSLYDSTRGTEEDDDEEEEDGDDNDDGGEEDGFRSSSKHPKPKLKKFKSTTSSEQSIQNSIVNYESGTDQDIRSNTNSLNYNVSNTNANFQQNPNGIIPGAINNTKGGLINPNGNSALHTSFSNSEDKSRSRPVSILSDMSNFTYNSEYSTDGDQTTSSIGTGRFLLGTPGSLTNSGSIKKNSKKISSIRRSHSQLSSNSSTSDLSSKNDSFYDITTASSPLNMDIRAFKSEMPHRGNISETTFPHANTVFKEEYCHRGNSSIATTTIAATNSNNNNSDNDGSTSNAYKGKLPWFMKRGKSPVSRGGRISRSRKYTNKPDLVIKEESSDEEISGKSSSSITQKSMENYLGTNVNKHNVFATQTNQGNISVKATAKDFNDSDSYILAHPVPKIGSPNFQDTLRDECSTSANSIGSTWTRDANDAEAEEEDDDYDKDQKLARDMGDTEYGDNIKQQDDHYNDQLELDFNTQYTRGKHHSYDSRNFDSESSIIA
ncbi:non-specific serine/threonine protein kinase SCDLUD_002149 [Saccharomycodes ludwigii]|uniref:non-specific serine/threonine protein kinase n=1 Tax=Saccharomycodes ludwigii TaxID=36035 RepID=UPI001E84A6D5|nr:hypothetical protein SCDLUD_002149 [Saccharomycodes ludwigii]KAH3902329.1 hypothetical protein SCDLUD_002149 [Saccharomycodes ludwigii]